MRICLLISAAAAFLLSACSDGARSEENQAAANAANVAANEAASAAPSKMPTNAAGFVQAVAASDLYEIESSRLARRQSQSAAIRSFAQRLEREHGNSTAELKTIASANGISVPAPALDAEQQAMLQELRSASGAAFDAAFIQQQRMAHQMVLMVIQNYRNGGDNEALKAFAAKAQPMVETHTDLLNYMKP